MSGKKVFILPIDGVESSQMVKKNLFNVFLEPDYMIDYVSHIKFNDAFHFENAKSLIISIYEEYPDLNIFYDFKLADTNGTNVNILKHYLELMRDGDIVTVNSNCSMRAFREMKEILPKGVKIAIVSVLTDTGIDECRVRRGMIPEMAILNDAVNILSYDEKAFSAVVCSPSELVFLKKNLPSNIKFIVPGIRDSWMEAGQQSVDRMNGVKEAIDAGADNLVMGSQLSKGNPSKGISALESRARSIERVKLSNRFNLVKRDLIETLKNLRGFYQAKKDENGKIIDHIVAYSGTYKNNKDETKNFVGDSYFNLSVIESHPQILEYFAQIMAEKIREYERFSDKIDCLVGVPSGGTKISQEVGRILGIPGISLEKKVTSLKTKTDKEKLDLVFRRNTGVVKSGDKVLLFEDLCNNFSTTEKAVKSVQDVGGLVVGVACIVNRSLNFSNTWKNLSIISGVNIPSGQFKQEDDEVSHLIKNGFLITDPKANWEALKKK